MMQPYHTGVIVSGQWPTTRVPWQMYFVFALLFMGCKNWASTSTESGTSTIPIISVSQNLFNSSLSLLLVCMHRICVISSQYG